MISSSIVSMLYFIISILICHVYQFLLRQNLFFTISHIVVQARLPQVLLPPLIYTDLCTQKISVLLVMKYDTCFVSHRWCLTNCRMVLQFISIACSYTIAAFIFIFSYQHNSLYFIPFTFFYTIHFFLCFICLFITYCALSISCYHRCYIVFIFCHSFLNDIHFCTIITHRAPSRLLLSHLGITIFDTVFTNSVIIRFNTYQVDISFCILIPIYVSTHRGI